VVFASFAALALGPARLQRDANVEQCWSAYFPDWSRPWLVPLWAVTSTLDAFRYCAPAAGQLLVPAAMVGGVLLWRQGRVAFFALLAAPLLLGLAAALMHRYPYGGARVIVYATPGLLLLIAAGVPAILDWLRPRTRFGVAFAVVCLLLPAVESVKYLIDPWRRPAGDAASAWVLSQREADDLVVGNEWPHLYYFRSLGEDFHYTNPGRPTDRFWYLHASRASDDHRRAEALTHIPPGWRVVRRRDFFWTTALLAVREKTIHRREHREHREKTITELTIKDMAVCRQEASGTRLPGFHSSTLFRLLCDLCDLCGD
jgi:hypothetical protein